MAIGFPTYGLLCPFCFSLGHPWPICFLWASLSFLLTLHSHGLLLTSLGFPNPITSFSSLGFIGLSLTLYFLCLHYFKSIYLLKAHLFISWACDLLFLSLGPNGFTTCLPTFCYPCGRVFFFLLGFSKMTLNNKV